MTFLDRQVKILAERDKAGEPISQPCRSMAGVDRLQAAALVDFCQALMNSNEFVYRIREIPMMKTHPDPAAIFFGRRQRTGRDRTRRLLGEAEPRTRLRRRSARPKTPHFTPKAKSVIWLFMEGGPSHIDLFDPKPELDGSPASRCRLVRKADHGHGHRQQHADAVQATGSSTARAASGFRTGIRTSRSMSTTLA